MKKIILLTILQLTIVMAGSFIMTEGSPLVKADTSSDTTSSDTTSSDTTITYSNFTPKPLPTQKFNVLDYGLKGDGVTNDSAALKKLAENTSVTNWYFPDGYTFLLVGIDIPSHVEAVFGGATIQTIYKNVTYPFGSFYQETTPATTLLIDGLNFKFDPATPSDVNGHYGAICFAPTNSIHNVEVRNCTFTGNGTTQVNGLTIYGRYVVGGAQHFNIYDNAFNQIGRAAVELVNGAFSDESRDNTESLNDINIFNNVFDKQNSKSWWGCAVSFSNATGYNTVTNNVFKNGWTWDVELDNAANATIAYNHHTGTREKFVGINHHPTEGRLERVTGKNYVHHNHMASETACIHVEYDSKTEIYENFINGQVWVADSSPYKIHDNTIVKNSDIAMKSGITPRPVILGATSALTGLTIPFDFSNNDVYNTGTGIGDVVTIVSGAASASTYKNNNLFHPSNVECTVNIEVVTASNNTCNTNYSGSIPIGRFGAGLK